MLYTVPSAATLSSIMLKDRGLRISLILPSDKSLLTDLENSILTIW